jgi:hypothetical protein
MRRKGMRKKLFILIVGLSIGIIITPNVFGFIIVNEKQYDVYVDDFKTQLLIDSGINNPPTIKYPVPENGTKEIPIDISELNVIIEDPEGDKIDWTIETQPNIGYGSGYGESNGSKFCDVSNLRQNTTYYWFVNATDPFGSGKFTKKFFSFTTEKEPEDRIPTVMKIKIKLIGRNKIQITCISYFDEITNWIDKDNQVRIEWEVHNQNDYDYSHGPALFHVRIREWQEDRTFPFLDFLREVGYIDTLEGDWIELKVPISKDNFSSGDYLIDVELLRMVDMLMVTLIYYINLYATPMYQMENSNHNIIIP